MVRDQNCNSLQVSTKKTMLQAMTFGLFTLTLATSWPQVVEAQTGFAANQDLKLTFSSACVGNIKSQFVSGPYSIKIELFNALFDHNSGSFLNLAQTPIETFIPSTAPRSSWSHGPLVMRFQGMEDANFNLAGALKRLTQGAKAQTFTFKNFEVMIPVLDLDTAARQLRPLDKTSGKGLLSQVAGLEISIVGPKEMGSTEVLKSRVAFNNVSSPIGDHITQDVKVDPTLKYSRYLFEKLWPQTATLISTSRPFFFVNGEHRDTKEDDDCTKGSSLRYKIDILSRSSATPSTPAGSSSDLTPARSKSPTPASR